MLVASETLKQDLAIDLYRKQNKYIGILTETHIKHDQILHIRNNWLGPIFLSLGSSHTKGFIDKLHPGLEGVTEVDTVNVREMKTKLYLDTLILLWIEWTGMVEMKHKDFIDVVPKARDLHSYKKIC